MKKIYPLLLAFVCVYLKSQEIIATKNIKTNITLINKSDKLLKVKANNLIQLELKPNEQGKFQEELIPVLSNGSNVAPLTYIFSKNISIEENEAKIFSLFARININNNGTITVFAQLTPASTAPFVIIGKANQALEANQPYAPSDIKEINLMATIEANKANSTLTMTIDRIVK